MIYSWPTCVVAKEKNYTLHFFFKSCAREQFKKNIFGKTSNKIFNELSLQLIVIPKSTVSFIFVAEGTAFFFSPLAGICVVSTLLLVFQLIIILSFNKI